MNRQGKKNYCGNEKPSSQNREAVIGTTAAAAAAATTTKFNGNRLRQLQLERARSSLSMTAATGATVVTTDNESDNNIAKSKQAAFRRWQSLNNELSEEKKRYDNTVYPSHHHYQHAPSTASSAAAASLSRSSNTSNNNIFQNNTLQNPSGPRKIDPETQFSNLNALLLKRKQKYIPYHHHHHHYRHEEENHNVLKDNLKLKYPHGMPRWGPRLVSEPTPIGSTTDNNTSNNNSSVVEEKKKSNTDNTANDLLEDSNNNDNNKKNTTTKENIGKRADEDTTTDCSTKSQTLSAIEKAKTQSKLAAARAVQNILFTSSSSSSTLSKNPATYLYQNKNNSNNINHNAVVMGGLGSRLLGRRRRHHHHQQGTSLLQSARKQQSHIIDHQQQQNTLLRQTISLDDSLHGDRINNNHNHDHHHNNLEAQSVQSFEFLNNFFSSPSTKKSQAMDSDQEESLSEDNDSDDGGNDDDEEDIEEFLSWDMRTTSGSDSILECNSDEETSDDDDEFTTSSRNSVVSEEDLTSPQSSPGRRRSFPPTLIPSEIDQESSSMYSDYSSLAMNFGCGKGAQLTEDEDDDSDEFFDSAESAIQGTPSKEQLHFDSRRCRELLSIRNKYLEQEEQKRLINPETVKRLSHTPPLTKVADKNALQELASRGRWLLSKQTYEYKVSIPAAQPPYLRQQPLASMPDDDDCLTIKPIPLVEPKISSPTSASNRKASWHKPHREEECNHQGASGQHLNNVSRNHKRLRRYGVQSVAILLFILRATRAYFRLQEHFQSNAVEKDKKTTTYSESHPTIEVFTYANSQNLSFGFLLSGMTRVSMVDMPVQRLLSPPAIKITGKPREIHTKAVTPKCQANTTIRKFWERYNLVEESKSNHTLLHDHFKAEQEPILPSPFLQELMVDAALSQDQTVCDVEFQICYSTFRSARQIPKEIEEASETDSAHYSSNVSSHNLLTILGDKLRDHGKKLEEKRRRRREMYSEDRETTEQKNLIHILGNKLRTHGQKQLQEKRRKRREIYRI